MEVAELMKDKNLLILKKPPSCVPRAPRKAAVAHFRLLTHHDYLRLLLYRIGIANSPDCTVCNSGQPRTAEHLVRYPALINLNSTIEKYWRVRALMAQCFSGGRDSVENNERAWRSRSAITDQNIAKVRDMIWGERSLRVRAVRFNLDRETVRWILTDELHKRTTYAKVVPKVLSDDQKQCIKDVWTFRSCVKGAHFTTFEEIRAKTENLLKGLPETSLQNCHQQWQHRMQKCVNAEGDYFEGNNVSEN
ncbi:HTH_48 domain-containing protein [Trichonephila clavipes]|nr:HTH_48 domain-containing protein [Trichonephila clavipes]